MILYSIETLGAQCRVLPRMEFQLHYGTMTMRNGTQVCTMPAPAELDNLEPQTMVRIGRASFHRLRLLLLQDDVVVRT